MKFKEIFKNPRLIGLLLIGIVLLVLIVSFIKASVGGTSSKEGNRDGYTSVNSVPGVSFEVSQNLCDYATAVMAVTKDVDFVKNASYSYKNGTDTYMLFNMSQYIVVVMKGTTFDFANTDTKTSLENNSLGGIWFSNASDITKDADRYSMTVNAEVVITNTIYNDFTGKLVTITDDGEEWSLFAGVVNAEDSSMMDMAKYVASTFVYDPSVTGEDAAIYEIPVDDTPKLTKVETVKVEEPEVSESIEIKQEESVVVEETEEIEKPEKAEEPAVEEETPEAPEEEEPVEEKIVPDEQKLKAENNQKQPAEESKSSDTTPKAYTSSIYSMLGIGKVGYASEIEQLTGSFSDIFVRADAIYNEAQTEKLIEEYIKSGDAYYDTMEAPLGTHWEAVSYSVKYDEGLQYYVNVSLVGMDGEKLKYRGISYSTKAYDILNKVVEKDGWKTGCIAFYAVPNGCTEYALAFGDSAEGTEHRAFYKVK